jgi:hypothetical protein
LPDGVDRHSIYFFLLSDDQPLANVILQRSLTRTVKFLTALEKLAGSCLIVQVEPAAVQDILRIATFARGGTNMIPVP